MSKLELLNVNGEKVKDIKLNDNVFGVEPNDVVLHEAIVFAHNNQRQGTHSTKTRAEVSGGGRKPWRQKGTGNARQGSIRAVQWRKGGIAFGPKPRDYSKKQNRKERRLALKSALTSKLQDNELVVVENLNLETNKTKAFNEMLAKLNVNGKALVVCATENENLYLAARNNNKVAVMTASEVNVLDLVATDYLVIDEASVKALEEVLN